MKNTCASQDFILTAVRANGDVLRYASGWHCDPEVVLTAIEKVQTRTNDLGMPCRWCGLLLGTCWWICGGVPCCSLCGYQTPAACGATWMKETLYHRVAKNVQRDLCGMITSEIHHPLMQRIVWYASKRKPINFQSAPPKKTPQPCSLLLFSDSLCVIVRCFSTTLSLETRFGHAAVMVNCWAFEQFHGG